ncbi:hypothetical protein P7C73_g6510, partial [Tremellales sp. Uapishka_1]
MSLQGPPPYQAILRSRLMERQAAQESTTQLIGQYRKLAKLAKELKVRNRALLRSGGGAVGEGSTPSPLLAHLDSQLTHLRGELANLYRTQAASQNKQLSMADALRDRDEEVRGLREEVRELREIKDNGRRKEKEWEERWRMRENDLVVCAAGSTSLISFIQLTTAKTLHDEVFSLNLELSSVHQQKQALQADNASLLQRWLDKMNLTAEEMNVEFEREKEKEKKEGETDFRNGGKKE